MDLEWRTRGLVSFTKVRFRHLNSGKLLTVKVTEKKKKRGGLSSKGTTRNNFQQIVTLGQNLTTEQINERLSNIQQIENENKYNSNFNGLTDYRI